MTDPPDVQAAFAAVLVDEWVRSGVTDAVVAPGSRSTPLLVALAADGRLRLHVVLDERSAGFIALGIGLAPGRPAPVVTTSGTAAVELHPAVVEASHAGVPLLAVTADRPPELHQVGAPQTVEQEDLYGAAVRWAVSPGVPDLASSASWRPLAARSVAAARGGPAGPGPVHLNLAFREPLLGSPAAADPGLAPAVAGGRGEGAPWHQVVRVGPGLRAGPGLPAVLGLLGRFAGRRGLIVAGAGAAGDGGDPAAVVAASRALGWPLLADPRSGCRLPGPPVVAAADALLRVPSVASWQPEVVLRLGQPWMSKVLGQWLGALDESVPQVLVDPYGRWPDPQRRVSHVVAADPAVLVAAVAAQRHPSPRSAPATTDWCEQWARAEAAAQGVLERELGSEAAPSEPGVARRVLAAVPHGGQLVVSSSMPVRDVECYGAPRGGVRVLANLGANGIDGVVSTVLGAAMGSGGPTVGLVGDLAFLYDSSALLGASRRPAAVTLVVVDNDGGGIFSFLPQAAALPEEQFERYWGTPHGLDLLEVASAYGIAGSRVTSSAELATEVAASAEPGVRVVAVSLDRASNVAVHDRLHAAVAEAVSEAL